MKLMILNGVTFGEEIITPCLGFELDVKKLFDILGNTHIHYITKSYMRRLIPLSYLSVKYEATASGLLVRVVSIFSINSWQESQSHFPKMLNYCFKIFICFLCALFLVFFNLRYLIVTAVTLGFSLCFPVFSTALLSSLLAPSYH